MSLLAQLADPNAAVTIHDDPTAKLIASEAGIIAALDAVPLSKPWTWAAANHDHPSAHVYGLRITGFDDPTLNGYIVHLFPKKYTVEEARYLFLMESSQHLDEETAQQLLASSKKPA